MMTRRRIPRWLLAGCYLLAGYKHVSDPHLLLRIVPSFVPMPLQTVIATGICEILGAIGLLIPRSRKFAAVMLAIYAVCVFPANIKHMLDFAHSGAAWTGWLYHGPRMLLQPVIVWWSLYAGEVIDWPWRRSQQQA